jgi:hypothetical protein
MDFLATNGNAQLNWSDRVPPTYASDVVAAPGYGWEGKGCPWEYTAAISEVNAGGSPLNFDGDTNDWNWAARRTAKRTVEISTIFRRVFGSGAMMARVRPVLESQEGYVAFWLLQQTHMLEDYYNCASRVATPHPPGYYIYGGGGSAYYNPDNSSDALSLSNIWTSSTFANAAWAPVWPIG